VGKLLGAKLVRAHPRLSDLDRIAAEDAGTLGLHDFTIRQRRDAAVTSRCELASDTTMDRVGAPWSWAGQSLVGLVLAFLVAFAIAITLLSHGFVPGAATGPRLDLALFLLLFGAFGQIGVAVAARFAFGDWLQVRARDLVLPAIGVALAIGEELALHAWAEASIGFYDSDFIGWTAGLSYALVGMAVARFGWAIAPASAEWSPRLWTRIGAVLVLFAVLSNVPGALDGIGPHSGAIAVMVVACGAYAIAAAVPPAMLRR
jgi:hypothetical protein